MADSKVFMFPDNVAGNGNNSSLDPNLLFAMMCNGGMGGNGNWMWIIFLFFLFPLLRNGGWFGNNNVGESGFLSNMINNNDGRQLLDAAINRNGASIDKLASMFGCGKDAIISAINGVQQAICGVNGNVADVKYAMSLGNKDIAQQLASCCCNIRESITQGNYQNQLQTVQQTNQLQQAINGVGVGQERGFSSVAYETQRQTCDIKGAIKDLSTQMTAQFGELATRALQDKLDAERDKNTALMNQLSNEHQTLAFNQSIAQATAPINAGLVALSKEVDAVKCKLPETATIPNPPGVLMPNCVAWNAGLYGLNPFAANGSIWS